MSSKPQHLRVSNLKKKPICFAPWTNLYANKRNGWWRFKVCCLNEEAAEVDNIDEYFKSNTLKETTEALQEGKFPKSCIRCSHMAEAGVDEDIALYEYQILKIRHRKKLYKNKKEQDIFVNKCQSDDPNIKSEEWVRKEFAKLSLDDIKEILNDDDEKFIQLDVRPGNLCNLKCKMCNTGSSTEIAKEYIELHKDKRFIDRLKSYDRDSTNQIAWDKPKGYYESLTKNYTNTKEHKDEIYELFDYANLRRLKLLGGEPSIDPTIISILGHLKEQDLHNSNDFKLQITSNLTNVNKIWTDYFDAFSVKLTVSMDGAGRSYEYIRAPAKWKTIKSNMFKIPEKLYQDMSINIVASNILYLDIKHWIPELADLQNQIPFYSNIIECYQPNHLTLKAIPYEYRLRIHEDINTLKNEYLHQKEIYKILNAMDQVLTKELSTKDHDKDLLRQFFLINRKQDQLRKQNLFDINYTKEIYDNIEFRK